MGEPASASYRSYRGSSHSASRMSQLPHDTQAVASGSVAHGAGLHAAIAKQTAQFIIEAYAMAPF